MVFVVLCVNGWFQYMHKEIVSAQVIVFVSN